MVKKLNLLFVGALLLTYVACIHGSYENHLEELKDECSIWNSCQHMIPEYRRDFTQRNCECDHLCLAFNDCCYDAKARKKFPYHFRNRLDTCMGYGEYDDAVYVVGSCPSSYNGPITIKRFCEGYDDFRDPTLSVPVSHSLSATTYRNKYCSLCHGVPLLELVPWKLYIRFDDSYPHLQSPVFVNNDDVVFIHLFQKWGVFEGDTFRPFEYIVQKPDSVTDVRHCRRNLISSCPASWEFPNVTRNCRSYVGVVHYQHHAYRNIDCAVCNGVSPSQLTCVEGKRKARLAPHNPFLGIIRQGDFDHRHRKSRYGLTYDQLLTAHKNGVCHTSIRGLHICNTILICIIFNFIAYKYYK